MYTEKSFGENQHRRSFGFVVPHSFLRETSVPPSLRVKNVRDSSFGILVDLKREMNIG